MSEYGADYKGFDNAITNVSNIKSDLKIVEDNMKEAEKLLSNPNYFVGDIADSCKDAFPSANRGLKSILDNLSTISEYLGKVRDAYKNADASSEDILANVGKISLLNMDGVPISNLFGDRDLVSSTSVSSDVKQYLNGYAVECWEEDGLHRNASYNPTSLAYDTGAVHAAWVERSDASYKDGVAVLNVDGTDCYLVATTPKFGKVGDVINVNFEDGTSIPCVIADEKNLNDSNCVDDGHYMGNGDAINVLEFMVDTQTYREKGNPTTSGWGLEWNSGSAVSSVDNYGSVI